MTEREMFDKFFQRPCNFFNLSMSAQWEIDKRLGILDWIGEGLTELDHKSFKSHYKKRKAKV